ncbi:hypothetical protein ACRAWG_06455 [Methylobacterium sp. P31]
MAEASGAEGLEAAGFGRCMPSVALLLPEDRVCFHLNRATDQHVIKQKEEPLRGGSFSLGVPGLEIISTSG